MTLNAVFFIVSATTSNGWPFTFSKALCTTPGPLTPTLITLSSSPIPWNAPAINGLFSTALQNTTNLAHPNPFDSLVNSAVSFIIVPLTDAHTFSVSAKAFGIDFITILSPFVYPFCTNAENPPMKSIPKSWAALSRVCANFM